MMIKKLLLIILLVLVSAVDIASAREYKVKEIPLVHLHDRTRYVSNPDNILTAPVVAQIDSILYSLEQKTGIQTLVAVVTGIEGGDCFDFAHRLGQENGVGERERNNGLVVLLSTDERCVQFATGYGLEGVLPDALCKRVQMNYMVEHFGRDDWDKGMLEGIKAVAAILDGSMEPLPEEDDDTTALIIFMAFIFLTLFATLVYCVYIYGRCPKCKKKNIIVVSTKFVRRSNGYLVYDVTYKCKDCGHFFVRQQTTVDPNYRGGTGGAFIGGGFGRSGGGGIGRGGSFGGGSFGGGGAGSRF